MARKIRLSAVQHPADLEKLLNAIVDELALVRTLINELKTDHNTLNTFLQGDFLLTPPGLAIATAKDDIQNNLFYYVVNGVIYAKAAVDGTGPGNDVIPQSKYGAVAFDIGADGTIDAIEAADNATGYNSSALALAGLAAVAADHVRLGTVTATKSDGAFTFGTTELDAANVTAAIADGTVGIAGAAAAVAAAAVTAQITKSA